MANKKISDFTAWTQSLTALWEVEDGGNAYQVTIAQIQAAAQNLPALTANEAPGYDDFIAHWNAGAAAARTTKLRNLPGVNPRNYYRYFHDFPASGGGSLGEGLAATAIGTGAICSNIVGSEAGAFGIARCETGTTTTGYANIGLQGILAVGGARFRQRIRARIAAVSDATDTYVLRHGFGNTSGTEWTDGIGWRYTHSVNAGWWLCFCRSGGTETTADAGVGPTVGSTGNWQALDIEVNAAGTSVSFYVNDALVATITATIPTVGLGLRLGQIVKSAGTTNRTVDIDLVDIFGVFTAAR